MTVPLVVEKQQIDLKLGNGIDESGPEETIDWTKNFVEAENVSVDGDSVKVRPGLDFVGWQSDYKAPTIIGETTHGLVGIDRGTLLGLKESSTTWDAGSSSDPSWAAANGGTLEPYVPAFDITQTQVAGTQGATIVGVAVTSRYKAVAYRTAGYGNSFVSILDKNSGNTLRVYAFPGDGVVSLLTTSDRYIFVFSENSGDIGQISVIDTDGPLPASGDGPTVLSASNLFGGVAYGLLGATYGLSGVYAFSRHNFVNDKTYIDQYTNAGAFSSAGSAVLFPGGGGATGAYSNRLVGTFDSTHPSFMSLTGWWRLGNYSTSGATGLWTGNASAGTSGSLNVAEATNYPAHSGDKNIVAAGTAYFPANFDGTNDRLKSTTNLNTLFGANEGSIAVLFKADTADAYAGDATSRADPAFISDETVGALYFGFSDSGVALGVYDGATFNTVKTACSTAAWHLAIGTYDNTASGTIYLSLDGGAFSSVNHGPPSWSGAPGDILIGQNYNNTKYFDGQILEVMTWATKATNTERDNIKSYVNQRYGLSL